MIRTTRKAGASQSQDASSKSSRSSDSSIPSLQQWLARAASPRPSSSVVERPYTASSPPPIEQDDVRSEEVEALQPPETPPPPLVQPSASGYASSAVTTLKTPSTVRRVEREPTPEGRPQHIQLLEDMAAQLPQGYSLHEQDDCEPEPHRDSNHQSRRQAYDGKYQRSFLHTLLKLTLQNRQSCCYMPPTLRLRQSLPRSVSPSSASMVALPLPKPLLVTISALISQANPHLIPMPISHALPLQAANLIPMLPLPVCHFPLPSLPPALRLTAVPSRSAPWLIPLLPLCLCRRT